MCIDCWTSHGSPLINNARVRKAVKAGKRVYEFSCVGGGLHCLLDDWNVNITTPYEYPEKSKAQSRAERSCQKAFDALSESERYSALAFIHRIHIPIDQR